MTHETWLGVPMFVWWILVALLVISLLFEIVFRLFQ